MFSFKFLRFTLVVYVSHTVNVLVNDILLNITSQKKMIFTLLHIGSRLFELFSKEVRVKKQPRMSLKLYITGYERFFRGSVCHDTHRNVNGILTITRCSNSRNLVCWQIEILDLHVWNIDWYCRSIHVVHEYLLDRIFNKNGYFRWKIFRDCVTKMLRVVAIFTIETNVLPVSWWDIPRWGISQ